MQIVTANNIDINEILKQMIFIIEIILLSIISPFFFIIISLIRYVNLIWFADKQKSPTNAGL
jgi:hypothetical protein